MGEVPEIRELDKLLGKFLQKKITILSQNSQILTAPGENYGSIMAALNVTIEDEHKSKQDLNLVAKFIPRNPIFQEIFQVQISFIKELRVYTKIVPALAKLEDEYNINKNRTADLFAKCYGGRSNLKETEGFVDNDSILLLENLKNLGFETGDRLKGFDFESAVFILENLARFHASPIVIKHLKPQTYECVFLKTLCVELNNQKFEKEVLEKFIKGMQNIVYQDKYKEQVDNMGKNLMDKFTSNFNKAADPQETFVTFCHSDFWVNNMMLKKDAKGKPSKLIIVDFQTPVCQSLVSDLLFFMYTSVSTSVLYEKVDDLIKIYYESFIERLKEFNLDLKKFSWDEFTNEIKKNAPDILSQILMMYKHILLERGKIKDMDNVSHDELLNLDSVSDHCRSCMIKTFAQFAEKGWI